MNVCYPCSGLSVPGRSGRLYPVPAASRRQPPPLPLPTAPSVPTAPQAIVRSLPGEPNLSITLTVGGKQRNLDRWAQGSRLSSA